MSTAKIGQKDLDQLRKKARAHDVYLRASQAMARRALFGGRRNEYLDGYRRALSDFDQAIVDADREMER